MKCNFQGKVTKVAAGKNGFDVNLHVTSGLLKPNELSDLAAAAFGEGDQLKIAVESVQGRLAFDAGAAKGADDSKKGGKKDSKTGKGKGKK